DNKHDVGSGNPHTGGVKFKGFAHDGPQLAVFGGQAGRFTAPGARMTVGVDVKFDTPPVAWSGVGILGMGQGVFFGLQPETSGSVQRAVVTTADDGSIGSTVVAGDTITPGNHWLRIQVAFALDGSDLVVDGTV